MLHNVEVGDSSYVTQSSHAHKNPNVTQLKRGTVLFEMGLISSYSSQSVLGYNIKATTLLGICHGFLQLHTGHLLWGQGIKAWVAQLIFTFSISANEKSSWRMIVRPLRRYVSDI